MKRLFVIVVSGIVTVLLTALNSSAKEKPSWVMTRPVSLGYYVGIGVVQKGPDDQNLHDIARGLALKDISSEISSYISSRTDRIIIEKAGILFEDYKSNLTTKTQAHLEGYNLIDSWEDENEYWVYYRLSKEIYLNKRKQRLEKAKELSFDYFKEANFHKNNSNISQSVLLYLKAYYTLQDFIAMPLKVYYENSEINLESSIYTSLQELLNKINLTAHALGNTVTVGKPLSQPIIFSTYYMDTNNKKTPLPNLPLRFSFIKGAGQLLEETTTNEYGIGECRVIKITATGNIQVIQGEIDTKNFKTTDSNFVHQNLVNSLIFPHAHFQLNVLKISVFVKTIESHFIDSRPINYIEPIVKNLLSSHDISFTADISKADFLLEINAVSRQGVNAYDIYTAYVDLTIAVTDLSNQTEIYETSQNNVKGMELDYNKAELNAFKNAGKKIKNILPEILSKIQN